MATQRMPALQSFIDDLRAIWASDSDIGSCMEKAKPLLEKLVGNQELQDRSVDWPSTEGRKNLLLSHLTVNKSLTLNIVLFKDS